MEREDPALVEEDEIKLPIDPALAVSFFGEIHEFPRLEEGEENDDPLENEEKVKAVSTVESYRSAIVWFYKKKNQRLEEELDVAISASQCRPWHSTAWRGIGHWRCLHGGG